MGLSSSLIQGDAFRLPLRSSSVHCVVTSPPYWGLREYEGEQGREPLGLESTPDQHIARTVEWAREVWRVLRPDGVFWLNYSDCYATSRNGRPVSEMENDDRTFRDKPFSTNRFLPTGNLMLLPQRIALALQAEGWIVRQELIWSKPNPMPESRVGWRWQRRREEASRISGGGKQPTNKGSLTAQKGGLDKVRWRAGDGFEFRKGAWRHTRAHESVFMLTKNMRYWSDLEAVREPLAEGSIKRISERTFDQQEGGEKDYGRTGVSRSRSARQTLESLERRDRSVGRNPRDVIRFEQPSLEELWLLFLEAVTSPHSVMDLPTEAYPGAHFATFPPGLIAPLIQATCPRWCCPECRQGWAPVVELPDTSDRPRNQQAKLKDKRISQGWADYPESGGEAGSLWRQENPNLVLGYRPTCDHPHSQEQAVPGIVLDPFVGSGTSVMVARELLRVGIGLDISRPYLTDQARFRSGLGSQDRELGDLPLFSKDGQST